MLVGILFMSVTPQDMFYVNLPTFSTLQRALWVQQVLDVCVESVKVHCCPIQQMKALKHYYVFSIMYNAL